MAPERTAPTGDWVIVAGGPVYIHPRPWSLRVTVFPVGPDRANEQKRIDVLDRDGNLVAIMFSVNDGSYLVELVNCHADGLFDRPRESQPQEPP